MSAHNDPDLVKLAVTLTEITFNGFRESRKSWGTRPMPTDLEVALHDPRKVFDLMLSHLSKIGE